jgi:RNA 3'-terminal phosphate cyclase (RTC), insert domain
VRVYFTKRYIVAQFQYSFLSPAGIILTVDISVTSHAVRVSPQISNRMIDSCRSVLNRYIPDIYLYSDVYKGEDSGKYVGVSFLVLPSPPLSISLIITFSPPPPADLQDTHSASSPNQRHPCYIVQRPFRCQGVRRRRWRWRLRERCWSRYGEADVWIGSISALYC